MITPYTMGPWRCVRTKSDEYDIHKIEASGGCPFPAALRQPALARRALRTGWDQPVLLPPRQWELPAGAFGNTAGPT